MPPVSTQTQVCRDSLWSVNRNLSVPVIEGLSEFHSICPSVHLTWAQLILSKHSFKYKILRKYYNYMFFVMSHGEVFTVSLAAVRPVCAFLQKGSSVSKWNCVYLLWCWWFWLLEASVMSSDFFLVKCSLHFLHYSSLPLASCKTYQTTNRQSCHMSSRWRCLAL